jgi:RNA polymerase sigma factor (sigma-70 family)
VSPVALRTGRYDQYEVMGQGPSDLSISDEALLVRAARDPGAFEALYRRHVDAVVRFAARHSTDPEAVVDLASAVWLEVVASLDRFDPRRGRALPWILGIAANLCASERRRRAREREAIRRLAGRRVLDEDDYAKLEREIDAARAAATLHREIGDLPPAERVTAELVLIEGLTPAQVGDALGIPSSAVRMRLTRARRRLRAAVESGRRVPASANKEASS